jgi:MauM/NapG family ferredoxin protein
MSKEPKSVSRRELLTFWRKPLQQIKEDVAPSKKEPPAPSRPPPLRPPGMMHEVMLVSSCTRCGKCVEACPADAITPLDASWGKRMEGTPAIFARQQPCVLCDGLQCSHVCPSGALIPVYVPKDVTMGTAILDATRCVTYAGQPCDACKTACLIEGALVFGEGGRMTVVEDRCVGCGLCEHMCPTDPAAIRVQPRD